MSAVAPEHVIEKSSELRKRTPALQTEVEHVKGSQQEITKDERGLPQEEKKLTELQTHSAFFDRNGDGKITIGETYSGFRAIGFNMFTSFVMALILNFGLAWPTSDHWWPTSTIYLKNIHRSNHGSDSGAYTEDGEFNERKFNEVFDRYDRDHDGYWTWQDSMERLKVQRKAFDFFGWTASFLEWSVTMWLCSENGKLSKETLKGVYDGSLFYKLEAREKDKKAAKKAAKQAKKQGKSQPGPSH